MKDGQKDIYYVAGETTDKIDMLPQVDSVKDKGYEILYLTDYVDEFALRALSEYDGKLTSEPKRRKKPSKRKTRITPICSKR